MTLHRLSVRWVAVFFVAALTGCGANSEGDLSEKGYGQVELGTRSVRKTIAVSELITISTAYVAAGGENSGGVLNSDRLVVYNTGEVKYEFRESRNGRQFNESLGYLSASWTDNLTSLVSVLKETAAAIPVQREYIQWFNGDDYGNVVGTPSRLSLRKRTIDIGSVNLGTFENPLNDTFKANFSAVYNPTSASIELMLRMRYLLNYVRDNYAPPAIPLVVN